MPRSPSAIRITFEPATTEISRVEPFELIPDVVPVRGKMRKIAFGWYGGKFSHLDWLLPLLPECHHYCEPFGGSAAVVLNRPPSPVETYNDLDGEVVNFFRVLREEKDKPVQEIGLTRSRPAVEHCYFSRRLFCGFWRIAC